MDRHPFRSGPLQDLLLGALVAAGVLLLMLPQVQPDVAAHPDIVRDLLLARNCQGELCVSRGSSSSMVFFHGFALNRFWGLLPNLGLPLSSLPLVIVVLHALGLGLFFHVLSRESGRWTALLATLAYAMLSWERIVSSAQVFAFLPALLNLVIFLLHASCRAAPSYRLLAAAACAFLWGVATQVHLEMLLFLPGAVVALLSVPRLRRSVPALLFVLAASWMLVSWDSFAANCRILFSGAWASSLTRAARPWLSAGAWSGCLLALAWGWRFLSRRGEDELPLFDRIMMAATAGYVLAAACVMTGHFFDAQYLETLVPPGLWLAAKAGRLWLLPLALLVGIRWQHQDAPRPGLNSPLTLGEVRSLSGALRSRGWTSDDIYARVSSGQGIVSDLQSGLWLEAPCLRDARRLGEAAPGASRALLTAVPSEFRSGPADGLRIPGLGRDFLLMTYAPWLDLTRFAPVGDERRGWRTLGFDNPGFGRAACMDGDLPYAARSVVRLDETPALVFAVRVPARGGPRVLYLPAASGPGRGLAACAGRFTSLRGMKGRLSKDGRRLELSPAGAAREGAVTIEWPRDERCGPGARAYPQPVAELPSALFARLEPFLD